MSQCPQCGIATLQRAHREPQDRNDVAEVAFICLNRECGALFDEQLSFVRIDPEKVLRDGVTH